MSIQIGKNRQKTALFTAVILMTAMAVTMFFLKADKTINPQTGAATGKSALASMKELCGESRIDALASLKEAAKAQDAENYLLENSIYMLDAQALEKYAQTYVTSAESTAQAKGISTEQLILEEWGYESMEDYQNQVLLEAETFVKKRLAVYAAAEKLHIRIGQKEYASLLDTYAARFGYNTTEEFTYACIPATIANEMLYEKTLSRLKD